MGHSSVVMTPLESLLRVDKLITHPTFLNQPFIQTPKAEPNEDVCFEKGDVIYNNSKINEWSQFIMGTIFSWSAYLFTIKANAQFFL